MNSLLSSNFGLAGLVNQQMKKEQFYDVEDTLSTTVIIVMLIFVILFSVLLLVSVYKMVPSYKGLHTFLIVLFGLLYFVPMLSYYVIGNSYKLTKSNK